jgi:hypothetical protein
MIYEDDFCGECDSPTVRPKNRRAHGDLEEIEKALLDAGADCCPKCGSLYFGDDINHDKDIFRIIDAASAEVWKIRAERL